MSSPPKLEDQKRIDEGAREGAQATSAEAERLARERSAWEEGREPHRLRLEQARERWNAARDASHAVALRIESMRVRRDSLRAAIEQTRKRIAAGEARCRELEQELQDSAAPAEEAKIRLQSGLERKSELEANLRRARSDVEKAEGRLAEVEQVRQKCASRSDEEREVLERARMAGQEVVIRRKTLEEQLEAEGLDVQDLLSGLDRQASEEAWEAKLAEVSRRISRLGPINLAAIGEHEELAEQKAYLDAQHGRPFGGAGYAQHRDSKDRPGNARAIPGDVRPGQCRTRPDVPTPLRWRRGEPCPYRR